MDLKSDKQQNIQTRTGLLFHADRVKPVEAGREETESPLAVHDPESPASTNRLMEEVCERENLKEALRRVKANKGSAGIDGMTVGQLDDYLKQHWPAIREQLLNGTYEPKPVRRVEIPKPDGGVRKLGIPTVLDRLIQQAVMQVLQTALGPDVLRTAATGFGRDGRLIRQWHRRSSISPKATAGASILIWRNSSIESITTN